MSDSLWLHGLWSFSDHGISQTRILEWFAISFSRGSSWPKDWIHISLLAGRVFTNEPHGKPLNIYMHELKKRDLSGRCKFLHHHGCRRWTTMDASEIPTLRWAWKLIQPLWKKVSGFLKKLGINLPYDPAIPLLSTYPEKTTILKDICTSMFIAAIFTIARTWKQPRCPLTDVVHIYNGILLSHKKKWIWVSFSEVDETRVSYTEWNIRKRKTSTVY